MTICKNCTTHFDTKYCPNCGASAHTKRIDTHYLFHEVQHEILHLEKGFLFTTKQLLLKPGNTVRAFIEGERQKHYKPIAYLIICSIIYTVVSHNLELHIEHQQIKGNVGKVFGWITEHYNYSNLIEILFIGLTLKLFFRKREFNYLENLVLLCYLTGFCMLVGGLFIAATYVSKVESINAFFSLFTLIYMVWAIGQFYNDKNWLTYFKAFWAYILGFLLFGIAAVALGQVLNALNF